MFCYKCGNPVPDTARFCPKCGAEQKTEAVTEQPKTVKKISVLPVILVVGSAVAVLVVLLIAVKFLPWQGKSDYDHDTSNFYSTLNGNVAYYQGYTWFIDGVPYEDSAYLTGCALRRVADDSTEAETVFEMEDVYLFGLTFFDGKPYVLSYSDDSEGSYDGDLADFEIYRIDPETKTAEKKAVFEQVPFDGFEGAPPLLSEGSYGYYIQTAYIDKDVFRSELLTYDVRSNTVNCIEIKAPEAFEINIDLLDEPFPFVYTLAPVGVYGDRAYYQRITESGIELYSCDRNGRNERIITGLMEPELFKTMIIGISEEMPEEDCYIPYITSHMFMGSFGEFANVAVGECMAYADGKVFVRNWKYDPVRDEKTGPGFLRIDLSSGEKEQIEITPDPLDPYGDNWMSPIGRSFPTISIAEDALWYVAHSDSGETLLKKIPLGEKEKSVEMPCYYGGNLGVGGPWLYYNGYDESFYRTTGLYRMNRETGKTDYISMTPRVDFAGGL